MNSEHYSGIIYNKDDIDMLLVCSSNGYVEMWNLFDKKLIFSLKIDGSRLMDIVQWNKKYIITTDYKNKSIKIIDIIQKKIIANMGGDGIISLKKIKKINNNQCGQGIISCGFDNYLKLWTL